MSDPDSRHQRAAFDTTIRMSGAAHIDRIGYAVCVVGGSLPLFWIGIRNFMHAGMAALAPLVAAAPWIAWMPRVFGQAGASYLVGVVEVPTSLLFLLSLWSPRAGIAAGTIGTLIFAVTSTLIFGFPIWRPEFTFPFWNPESGGFPWINQWGEFLIKDVALLGISILVLANGLRRIGRGA